MKIKLTDAELLHLNAFIDQCTDAERLSAREAVLDLYDIERPISMNFVFIKGGIGVDGAAELLYSEEADGFYMGERIEDAEALRAALREGGALPADTL